MSLHGKPGPAADSSGLADPRATLAEWPIDPCGVCRERLAAYGPDVLAAVADRDDPTAAVWKRLADLLPDYWLSALTEDAHPGWLR